MYQQKLLKLVLFNCSLLRCVYRVLVYLWRLLVVSPVIVFCARADTRIRTYIRIGGASLLFSGATLLIGLIASIYQPAQTLADTSATINFQARLELISGAIAPDGTYNVEFNMYSNSGATGTPEWTEDYLNSAGKGISVSNGYLTANLGSITAFPDTINWNQQQWLTMDIGGTGSSITQAYSVNSAGWDGPMSPALQITAVPYAFSAGQLALETGSYQSTLGWTTQTASNSLLLPNENGTLCVDSDSAGCGFAPGTSASYIQNQTAGVQSSAGFDISGGGTLGGNLTLTGSSATIQGPTSGLTINTAGTSGTIQIGNTSGTGTITVGSSSSTQTVDIGYGSGAATVNIANISTAGNSINIATDNSAAVDTIDIGTGSTTVAGGKTINIGNGTLGSGGTSLISIGSQSNASTTTIQGGVNSTTPTISLQAAASGYIAIGTSNGNNIEIGSVGSTSNVSTVTIASSSTQGQTVLVGSTNASSTTTIQGGATSEELTNTGDTVSISNSTSAFQVSNGTNNVFSVSTSTTTPQAVLGTNTNLAGSLLFNTTTTGNPITLQATSDSTSGGYTLSLPTSAPSAGLCLQTSSSYSPTTGQLVFGLCSNANASISEVAYNDNHGSSSTVSSVTDTTQNVGDLIVVTVQIPSGTAVTGISGGDASNWSRVGYLAGDGTVNRVEMWEGVVSSVGSSTISLSPSGSFGNNDEITETEYTAAGVNAGTSWGVDTEATYKSTGSATVTFPTLEPQSEGELYEGYAQVQHTPATAGSSAGFTYQITGQSNVITYDPDVNPITSFSPTANQSSSGEADTIGAIFTAYVSSTAINNTTVPQLANFNVQAVISGSPAGVLQAANGDITDNILNFYGDASGQLSNNEVLSVTEPGNLQFGGLSNQTISVSTQTTSNTAGANLSISAATGNGTGNGGTLSLAGGSGGSSGAGGNVLIEGGAGNSGSSSGSVVVQSNSSNSTTAFLVQNASGNSILAGDTTNNSIDVDTTTQFSNATGGSGVTGTWQTGTTLSGTSCPAVIGSSAVAYGGYIYEIGGTTTGVGSGAVANICSASLNASTGAMGSWVPQTTNPLPQSLAYSSVVEANGYVYVIGGTNSSDQYTVYYAPLNNGTVGSWTNSSNNLSGAYPSGIEQAAATIAGNVIYIIGGDSNGTLKSSVYYASINPLTGAVGAWTSTTSLGTATDGLSAVVSNGYVYEMGGSTNSTSCSGNNQTTVDYAVINSGGGIGSWTSTTALPDGRYGATSLAWAGYVYNIGGTTTGGTCSAASVVNQDGVISTSGGISSWPNTASYPYEGWDDATAVYNGYIYILGGTTNGTTPLSSSNPNVMYASVNGSGSSPYNFAVSGNTILQSTTDSINAFVIQNAEGSNLLSADTLDSTVTLSSTSTSTSLLTVTNNLATTNTVVSITGNSLTSGSLLTVSSTSTGSMSNGAVQLIDTGAYTGGSGGLLNLDAGTKTGVVEYLQDNAITTGTELSLNSTSTLTSGALLGATLTSAGAISSGVVEIQDTHAYTGTGGLLNLSSGTSTGNVETLTANSLTTGIGLSLAANALTTGSGINVTSTTSTSITSGGLIVVTANSATTATGGLLQVQGNALTTGFAANLSSTSSSLSSGGLLAITDNSATSTATGGLLQISGTSLTGAGTALSINANTGTALAVDSGSSINLGSGTSSGSVTIKIPTYSGSCSTSSPTGAGLIFASSTATIASLCTTGSNSYFNATNITSGNTDVAENYSDVDNNLQPGDLVSLSNDGITDGVVNATTSNESDIIGVVSTEPGLLLSGINESNGSTDLVNPVPIALTGRVPTFVSTENGPIAVGDYLTISSTPGVAMVATGPGQTIGVALQSYSGSGVGTIEVKIEVGYYAGSGTSSYLQNGDDVSLDDLTVGGDTTLADLSLTGNANFNTINVSGPTTLSGLTVAGSTVIQGSLTVEGTASFASLSVGEDVEIGDSILIGNSQNGLTYSAGVAPSTATPLFNGSSRPVESIDEIPQYSGLTTSNNPNGTLTSGFDDTPGAFHSYYNWTTTQSTPQTESLYVRIPVPRDFSSFTSNDQICYYVYTDDNIPSNSEISATFYDTSDNAQSSFNATPTDTNTWQQQCTSSIGGTVSVDGNTYFTVIINLTASQNENVRIGEFSFDYLGAF